MPGSEETITTGGTGLEEAIPGSDVENLADAGPADIGRADVNLYGVEETITTGGTGSEESISSQ